MTKSFKILRSERARLVAACALFAMLGSCSSQRGTNRDSATPSGSEHGPSLPAHDYPNAGVRFALPEGWDVQQMDTRVVAICPGIGKDALLALGCNITVAGGPVPSYVNGSASSADEVLEGIRRHTLAGGMREISWRTFTLAGMPASEQVVESTAPGGGATRGRLVNAVAPSRSRVYSLMYLALPEFFDKHADGFSAVLASFAPMCLRHREGAQNGEYSGGVTPLSRRYGTVCPSVHGKWSSSSIKARPRVTLFPNCTMFSVIAASLTPLSI